MIDEDYVAELRSYGMLSTNQAADRIEALTAERDGLLRCVTDNHVALCRAEKAEAERDRLRRALHYYADFHSVPSDGPWGVNSKDFGTAARAALKGETQ